VAVDRLVLVAADESEATEAFSDEKSPTIGWQEIMVSTQLGKLLVT
jgi:hypothetical protein